MLRFSDQNELQKIDKVDVMVQTFKLSLLQKLFFIVRDMQKEDSPH